MSYFHINQVKRANKELGHHWFSRDTMRFFKSRVGTRVYKGKYFISSEQFECFGSSGHGYHIEPRKYTVRIANEDGSIDTVGEFQQFDTYNQAKRYIETNLD